MTPREEAQGFVQRGDLDGLTKWVSDMNESGMRRQATAILQELVALGMKSVVDDLRAKWSPDLDAYAAGEVDVPRCVLCGKRPCECPPFGSPEYFEMIGHPADV